MTQEGGLTQKGVSKGRAKKLGFMRLTPFWHTTHMSWLILATTYGWQPQVSERRDVGGVAHVTLPRVPAATLPWAA